MPWHLGAMHGVEWALSILLILGPIIALAVVVVAVRRVDGHEPDGTPRPGHQSTRPSSREII